MAKFVMMVQSRAKPGCDAEYNRWYDSEHLKDILAIPGVKSGRRFTATAAGFGLPVQPYLALYEIEADDPGNVLAEMGRRGEAGEMAVSDALDPAGVSLWFFAEHDTIG